MKDLMKEVRASVSVEYARAADKFGVANNSSHESYAVILEEFDEAQGQAEGFADEFKRYWAAVKCNDADTAEMLSFMQDCAEHAAAEWIQVAAMCHKAMQKKEGMPIYAALTLKGETHE